MEVKYGSANNLGSCNFCDSGKLSASGYNLTYLYKNVYQVNGSYIGVRFCSKCIEELSRIKELVDAKIVADTLLGEIQ